MLHWTYPSELQFAQRVVSRVMESLEQTLRQFQEQAAKRAVALGWEDAPFSETDTPWLPCPHCQRAGMERIGVPVPNDVFECPMCHAIVTDAQGCRLPIVCLPPIAVDTPTLDYDSWTADDPRR